MYLCLIRHLHICKVLHVRVSMYIRGMCVEVNVAYHRRQIGKTIRILIAVRVLFSVGSGLKAVKDTAR